MNEEACSRVRQRGGHVTGELRAGRTLFGPYTPKRDDNPLGFYTYLAPCFCFGPGLCVWGLLTMAGLAPSLKW